MPLMLQLSFGSLLLAFCAIVHVGAVALGIPYLGRIAGLLDPERHPRLRVVTLLSTGVLIVVAAHTFQIWLWTWALLLLGSFDSVQTSFYFSTVTYTTLGYGDIVLPAGHRVFGTFASVAGLLTFGISTAFLIGILVRIMPDVFRED